MKRTIWFSILCAVFACATVSGLLLAGVFGDLGLSTHGTIALLIGASLTIFLGVGLMALVFHSGRSHHDDLIRHDLPRRDGDG